MKTNILLWASYVLLCSVALYFALIYLDPDFGWRIRLGNEILKSGIPAIDPYSYTMPSFKFVDHEWATHIAMSLIYTISGYAGLAVIATVLYISTLVVIVCRLDKNWRPAHLLLVGVVLLHYFGVKPQLISWLFGALFFLMTSDKRWETRWRKWAPLFLLVWANVHGGFVFGVMLYTLKMIGDVIDKRKVEVAAIAWYLAAIAATFVNPYTYRLWEEIIRTGSDARLRLMVMEWTPQFIYMSVSSLFLVAWDFTIFGKYFRKTSSYEKLVMIVIFIFGFSSSRNFPLWVVVATPITARLFELFLKDTQKNKVTKSRIKKLAIGFFVIVLATAVFEMMFLTKEMNSYTESEKYPVKAIEYMRAHPKSGNVAAAYEWGGYMIWKYPEKKVFIDGRMPSWKQSASAHPGESADALDEFSSFLTLKKPMDKIVKKYNIDTILLPATYFEKTRNKEKNKSIDKFVDALNKNGFHRYYSDDVAVLYR